MVFIAAAVGDAADSEIPGILGRLFLFLKPAAENQVHGSLRVGSGMNNESVVHFQLGNPVLDLCGRVAVGGLVGDSCDSAWKRGSQLHYQLLLAVKRVSEAVTIGAI